MDRPLRRTTLRDGTKDRIVERMIAEMHRPVLQALQSRDPELAGKEMRAHIECFGSFVARRPEDHDRRTQQWRPHRCSS